MSYDQTRVCNTCFFDSNFPGVVIEDNGRCNHCNSADFRTNVNQWTDSNPEQLCIIASQLKEERIRKGAKYDCIIGASGGFDSSYVIYIAKQIMDLNPLVVSYSNDFTRKIASDNLQRICHKLKIDLKVVTSKHKYDKQYVKAFMEAFKEVGSYWGCCEFCGFILNAVIYKFAKENNISTMLNSTNAYEDRATQYLPKKYKKDYMLRNIYKIGITKQIKMIYHMAKAQYYYDRFRFEFATPSLIKAIFNRKTIFSLAPEPANKYRNSLYGINKIDVSKYIKWDVDNMINTMEIELGWETPEMPYLPMRFDCELEAGLIDQTFRNVTGKTMHTILCNNLIYGGIRTKTDLEETVCKYETEVYAESRRLFGKLNIKM